MKKLLLSLMLIALVCLSACLNQSVLPEETEPKFLPSSKESVGEFMLELRKMQLTGAFSDCVLEEEFCYNVTADPVFDQMGVKIFKFSDSGASFIWVDGEVYELCSSFGGYGFINAVPCDFDGDGNRDLLVASSWGSGVHRSEISVFNTQTKQSTVLYDTQTAENPNVDLMVRTAIQVVPNVPSEELPTRYEVCAADLEIGDDGFVNIGYTTTAILGFVEANGAAPAFVPDV